MRRHIVLLVCLLYFQLSYAYIIKDFKKPASDTRDYILLGSFGFKQGGHMKLKVTDYEPEVPKNDAYSFFMYTITDVDVEEFINLQCNLIGDRSHKISWANLTSDEGFQITTTDKGIYNLFFMNCVANNKERLGFKMYLEQYNIGPSGTKDYLPAGLSPLPTIYGMFSVVYFIIFFIWIFGYMRGQGALLNKVHYLMSALLVVKFLSLLFYAIDQHDVKLHGIQGGWAIAYYVVAVLKTAFFFVIVTLIGTGWTFFKPFLSDKDKKIIAVVIPLQILDNIAMVIVGTDAPGDVGWIAWKDIFRLVDIICCGAVLIPIIWSIKHLREASQSDGKAARNLEKLKLFRQFYLIVVSYIYFTRIIIYLLDAALPFMLLFLGDVFTEAATLSFFVVVGYKFRPMPAHPYFNVEEEDAARLEEMRAAVEED